MVDFQHSVLPLESLMRMGVRFPTETKSNFRVTNLAESETCVGSLLSTIANDPVCMPPRSGHAGNWANILSGASGAMDFNAAVCRGGWAEPVLHVFNQTESDQGQGDVVYRPGTVVTPHTKTPIPLRTWNGNFLEPRDRRDTFFVPYAAGFWEGQLKSILGIHGDVAARHSPGVPLTYEASGIRTAWESVGPALEELVDHALHSANPHGALSDLFGGQVSPNGVVSRDLPVAVDGQVELIDGSLLGPADVADRVKSLLDLVNNPESLLSAPPAATPLPSTIFMSVVSAHLATQRVVDSAPAACLHWGARHMVGSPPRFPGYFDSRSTVRRHRRLAAKFSEILGGDEAIEFVLLPAVIFSLWLPVGDVKGQEILGGLIGDIVATVNGRRVPEERQVAADDVVRRWRGRRGVGMSDRFRVRFQGIQGVGGQFETAELVAPPGFSELTLAAACSLVGALRDSSTA